MSKRKRIGDILIESGLIDETQLQIALENQKIASKRLGQTLVDLGFLSEEQLAKILSQLSGIPAVDVSKFHISQQAMRFVPIEFCKKFHLVPISIKMVNQKNHLIVAFSDPMNLEAFDQLRFMTNLPVLRVVGTYSGVEQIIRHHYTLKKGSKKEEIDWRELTLAQVSENQAGSMEVFRDGKFEQVSLNNKDEKRPDPGISKTVTALEKCIHLLTFALEKKKVLSREDVDKILSILRS